jgi:hypothetical protein
MPDPTLPIRKLWVYNLAARGHKMGTWRGADPLRRIAYCQNCRGSVTVYLSLSDNPNISASATRYAQGGKMICVVDGRLSYDRENCRPFKYVRM